MSSGIALFARTFVIGILVAAPVGAMGVLCIQRALGRGARAGLATGLGIATADGTYAAIAAFGLSALSSAFVAWQTPLRLVGGAVLVYGHDDFQKAATSTVFGVLDWTAKHRREYMTEAMWTMYENYLREYGPGGPEHYSWTEYSQKSKDLIRAKLFGEIDASTSGRWANGRLNHSSFHNWRSDIPWERRFIGGCVQNLGGTTAAGVVLIAVGTATAPVGVGLLLMGAGAGLIYFNFAVWEPAVTNWVEAPYYPHAY